MGPIAPSAIEAVQDSLIGMLKSQDAKALGMTSILMLAYSEGVKVLAAKSWLDSVTARKLMHIGCGPIFLLCWPLFSPSPSAPAFACLPVLGLTTFFSIVGLGLIKSESTVKSMSRSGSRLELLKGPFVYGVVIVMATFLYWRRLAAVVAISCLCAGDGFADLVGRRFGQKHRIPWCSRKSWAGTLGFIVASIICGLAVATLFKAQDWFPEVSTPLLLKRVIIPALAAALVETLPITDWDNVTVFATALGTDCWIAKNAGVKP